MSTRTNTFSITVNEGFPALADLHKSGFQALQLIDWCRGIAKRAAEAVTEQDDETEGCLQAIGHLLEEASGEVSLLDEFITSAVPANVAE
jgi:hypothetical protein